jgi:hypothetical protein
MKRLFFLAFIILGGCASLNKVESTVETNNKSNEYNYSDPDSKIRYQISNDQSYLHIKLNTDEFPTVMKILRSGLKICFDVKGKKNDKEYFQYPLAQNQQFSQRDRSKQGTGQQGQPRQQGQQGQFDLNKLVAQIPHEAIFSRNGETERILLSPTSSDIKVSIRAMNNDEIIYDAFIPLSRISKEGLSSLSKLSVGIVAMKNETSTQEGGRSGGGMSGGGRSGGGMSGGGRSGGGMSGGGRSGGGGGGRSGGGGGGMSGGGRSGGMDRSSTAKPLDFWFKLDLQKN